MGNKIPKLSLSFLASSSIFFIPSCLSIISGLMNIMYFVFVNLAPRFAALPNPLLSFIITFKSLYFFSNFLSFSFPEFSIIIILALFFIFFI